MSTVARVAAVAVLVLAYIAAPTAAYTPCATEDAPGPCVWDAQQSGNGGGSSFIVTADQTIVYL